MQPLDQAKAGSNDARVSILSDALNDSLTGTWPRPMMISCIGLLEIHPRARSTQEPDPQMQMMPPAKGVAKAADEGSEWPQPTCQTKSNTYP